MPVNGATTSRDAIIVPQISQDELFAFHQSHFSTEALADFRQRFLNTDIAFSDCHDAQAHDGWEEEEEDDLGYYEDGVKRTLTDEQIEIFRHSELRELRREQERLSAMAADGLKKVHLSTSGSGALSDSRVSKKKKKRKTPPKREPKPDLRKRTWDVVEAGLDSLDYD